jgi:hypothetical protein
MTKSAVIVVGAAKKEKLLVPVKLTLATAAFLAYDGGVGNTHRNPSGQARLHRGGLLSAACSEQRAGIRHRNGAPRRYPGYRRGFSLEGASNDYLCVNIAGWHPAQQTGQRTRRDQSRYPSTSLFHITDSFPMCSYNTSFKLRPIEFHPSDSLPSIRLGREPEGQTRFYQLSSHSS